MGNSSQNKYGGFSQAKQIMGQKIAGGKNFTPAVNQQFGRNIGMRGAATVMAASSGPWD
jgi:hypothetical protein